MGSPYAFTDLLSPDEAKKLYCFVTDPHNSAEWIDEFGISREVKLRNIATSQLKKIDVPKVCSDVFVSVADGCTQRVKNDLPLSYFMGGDDWWPPEYGDGSLGRVLVVVPDVNFPLEVEFSKSSGERFSGKSYNDCAEICITYPSEHSYGFKRCAGKLTYGERPPLDVQHDFLSKLLRRFELPNRTTQGLHAFEWRDAPAEARYNVIMPIHLSEWFGGGLQTMINRLIEESPSEYYSVYMNASVGGSCQHFAGERYNVREIAADLLKRIESKNDFDCYDLTFGEVAPYTWPQVAKARCKVRESTVTELGVMILESGVKCSISMNTYKDGYRFYVTFVLPEDLNKFYKSELYKRAVWSCDEL